MEFVRSVAELLDIYAGLTVDAITGREREREREKGRGRERGGGEGGGREREGGREGKREREGGGRERSYSARFIPEYTCIYMYM